VKSALRFNRKPWVIAHRGASALLPEHTLAAYARAIEDGADFIEPDLVMTRDGFLVARHDDELGGSTDIAERDEFASRRTTKRIDGKLVEGWFCEDFSLHELGTLRAREPLPDLRGRIHDGLHAIPDFDEIVELAASESRHRGRLIGVIPELKHSSWFHAQGMDPERALATALQRHGYLREAPFGIQSFEVGNLQRMRNLIDGCANVFLVQLIGADDEMPHDQKADGRPGRTYASMIEPPGLQAIRSYADVLAVHKSRILPIDPASGAPAKPTALVEAAHAADLDLHVWTLRPENIYLPPAWRCGHDPAARCEAGSVREMRALIEAGVDALFTDDPALGRRAVDARLV
jgi:glycerophosphoryl diester phosphodiesterase